MEGESTSPATANATATPPPSFSTLTDSSSSSSSSSRLLAEIPHDLLELQKNRVIGNLQGSINRYNDCFSLLHREIGELKLLQQERLELMAEFIELSRLVEEQQNAHKTNFLPGKENVSPSVVAAKRMPKSISIRSSGFLAVKNPPGGSPSPEGGGIGGGDVKLPHRLLVPVPGQGEGREVLAAGNGALEMEVYDQGMTKTELCNKWEEMAWCPYGDQCQFAHGIQELRPVIRHPRYKTQLCRMVGLPGGCPYGHRCHFRHASEKQDRPSNLPNV